jgi:hypothetical protein
MHIFKIYSHIYPLEKIIDIIETCVQIFYENYCIPTNKFMYVVKYTKYPTYKFNTTLSEIKKIILLNINKLYIIHGSQCFIQFINKVNKNNWIITDTDLRTGIISKFFCFKKNSYDLFNAYL